MRIVVRLCGAQPADGRHSRSRTAAAHPDAGDARGRDTYRELGRLKSQFDPDGVFRFTHAIRDDL